MRRKQSEKAFGGQITTPSAVPWLSSIDTDTPPAIETTVKLEDIHLSKQQPRRHFDPEALKELVESVKQHGILQPLLVRPIEAGKYEIVAGERRYRAATLVGLEVVPVVVRELSDDQAFALALIENLQREDLNPVEETEGILYLLARRLEYDVEAVKSLLYRMKNANGKGEKQPKSSSDESRRNVSPNLDEEKSKTVQEVFESLGLMNWLSFTTKRLPLLNLPEEILRALREGKLEYTKAQALARIKDNELLKKLLSEAIANNWSLSEIKEQIKAGSQSDQPPSSPEYEQIPERLKNLTQRIRKRQLWTEPTKQKQLANLLSQLEELLGDDRLE